MAQPEMSPARAARRAPIPTLLALALLALALSAAGFLAGPPAARAAAKTPPARASPHTAKGKQHKKRRHVYKPPVLPISINRASAGAAVMQLRTSAMRIHFIAKPPGES